MRSNLSTCSFITLCLCVCILASCYRMPGDDEFSVVPTTNNPAVTHEKTDSFIPGMNI